MSAPTGLVLPTWTMAGPGWAAGEYHGNDTDVSAAGFSTSALAASYIYAMWCDTAESTPIDRIGAEVTNASAGKSFRCAIYGRGSRGLPGALLLDSGNLSAASTGFIEASVAMTLPSGGVWLCINAEDATMQFRVIATGNRIARVGKAAGGGTSAYGCRTVSSAFGAFPATFPAGSIPNTNAPIVNVRAA